ncbi:hypothetical protein LXL04_016523 [Taraxacum kok-saghyz]
MARKCEKNKIKRPRPRLSTQRPRIPPTQDLQTQYPRRHSFATSMPDYTGSNQFDLNQEPRSDSSFSFREPPTFYSNLLMNEIPNIFHPYITNIENVEGDGNCEFRAVAVSLGYNQNYWPQIRSQLRTELTTYWRQYETVFGNYIHTINHFLSFTGTGSALTEYWMIMSDPDTGFLIANKYRIIVNFLTNAANLVSIVVFDKFKNNGMRINDFIVEIGSLYALAMDYKCELYIMTSL